MNNRFFDPMSGEMVTHDFGMSKWLARYAERAVKPMNTPEDRKILREAVLASTGRAMVDWKRDGKEWFLHSGNGYPFEDQETCVTIVLRDSVMITGLKINEITHRSGEVNWVHQDHARDVVAYRRYTPPKYDLSESYSGRLVLKRQKERRGTCLHFQLIQDLFSTAERVNSVVREWQLLAGRCVYPAHGVDLIGDPGIGLIVDKLMAVLDLGAASRLDFSSALAFTMNTEYSVAVLRTTFSNRKDVIGWDLALSQTAIALARGGYDPKEVLVGLMEALPDTIPATLLTPVTPNQSRGNFKSIFHTDEFGTFSTDKADVIPKYAIDTTVTLTSACGQQQQYLPQIGDTIRNSAGIELKVH